MIQWLDHVPAGKVDDRPVIQLDILPTALAAAGLEVRPEWKIDGVNLLPYLTGDKSGPPHEALYWRFGQQIAIRMGDWKLVKGVGSRGIEGIEQRGAANIEGVELYNLAQDIGEKDNLAEKDPAKLKELAAAWEKWNSQLIDPKWFPAPRRAGARQERTGLGNRE
jgi:arylsulfatase A-like enzyme